jgi:hypothetical protein
MNKADRDRMLELCSQIAAETDQTKFQQLVEELNSMLGCKDDELKDKDQDKDKEKESAPHGA